MASQFSAPALFSFPWLLCLPECAQGRMEMPVICCHWQVSPPCLHFSPLQPGVQSLLTGTAQRLPITSQSAPAPQGNFLWARQSGLSWPEPTGNSRNPERGHGATKMAITSSRAQGLASKRQPQSGLLFVFLCLHF